VLDSSRIRCCSSRPTSGLHPEIVAQYSVAGAVLVGAGCWKTLLRSCDTAGLGFSASKVASYLLGISWA
jgi:hypothetical protein